MKLDLPKPTADNLLALRKDSEAIRAAIVVKTQLENFVRTLQPATIAALAQQGQPGFTLLESISALSAKVADAQADAMAFNAMAKEVEAAEMERLKTTLESATRRLFACMELIDRYPRYIDLAKADQSEKLKKLTDAGASQVDAERIVSENQGKSVSELEAEFSTLKDELKALQTFVATKDEADLPVGFAG